MESALLDQMVDVLMRVPGGTTASAVLRHASEHDRLDLEGGKLTVTVPVGDTLNWSLVVEEELGPVIAAAGRPWGIEKVEFRLGGQRCGQEHSQ